MFERTLLLGLLLLTILPFYQSSSSHLYVTLTFLERALYPTEDSRSQLGGERHAIASIFVDVVSERLETMFLPERY
jgi:hypothetical protein